MRDYKKIVAYQLSDQLALAVYAVTKNYPKEEIFGLTSQLRRAVVSVAANIVEGSRRGTKKDYLRFLYVAQGSLSEVEYYIQLSKTLNYIKEEEYLKLNDLNNKTFSKLYGLIQSVEAEI